MGKAYYMGKRMVGKMPRHTMRNDESEWHYPKAKDHHFYGAQIGHQYETPDGDSNVGFILPKTAGWRDADTGEVHEDRDKWQAEHRLTLETKKASSQEVAPELQRHVNELRAACERMSMAERATFLSYLINQFMKWR